MAILGWRLAASRPTRAAVDRAVTGGEVAGVLCVSANQVIAQVRADGCRQHRQPVLVAFAAVHGGQHASDFAAREHCGDVMWAVGPHQIGEPRQVEIEDVPVQEEDRRERLVLRRGGDVVATGEVVQERRRFGGAAVAGSRRELAPAALRPTQRRCRRPRAALA